MELGIKTNVPGKITIYASVHLEYQKHTLLVATLTTSS